MSQLKSFTSNPEQAQRAKKLFKKIGIVIFIGLAYYIIVSITGFGIPCMIRTVTGFQCPGCGITRMCSALIGLDFKAAFEYHPVIFCSLPFAAVCFGAQAVKFIKTGSNDFSIWQHLIIWPIIVALLLFGVLRNFA